ncbi:ABC transporter substrate-binding protein [Iningainema tapete]|uniref:ABC transporter substrate-binding protein n=1 Tax=Iningainema tapete BLCC-T55 TaxID=2748662 RepID=A0A8J7BZ60_9CYAN|nr:ABC transporter substrate-binding protein [Iningainema tapete]MBD2775203.1 ABC transporter substrate-binding protein [Iningainema tapete BLCC-T55]
MRYLIGIDDTDNLTSGGTGKLARQLSKEIAEQNLAQTIGITRHQLHLSPEIPYTSHNSSACIMVDTSQELVALTDYCREYLLLHSEEESDVGLCVAAWEQVSPTVQAFGQQAKEIVLTQEQAVRVATVSGIFLFGLTGTKQGIIGALAAVGLRKNGNDGRFIWVPGLYDLSGVHTKERTLPNS